MDLLSWQNITLRKRLWDLISATNFQMVLYYETRKTICVQGREKRWKTGNENMFCFEVEDRMGGRDWKGIEFKWDKGRYGVESEGWKELESKGGVSYNPNGVLYEIQFFSITWWWFPLGGWSHSTGSQAAGDQTGKGRGVHTGRMTWSLSR